MGRTTYWMNTSIDLRIEKNPGEQGGGSWMRIGEQLHREFNKRARDLALSFEGRTIYEIMESFWPQAANDQSLPDFMREYGQIWLATPKVLVSNTRTEASHNTRVVGGDRTIEHLATLRAETEGNIGVGGANLATQLLRHDLLDEMLLFVHPVVLGSGRPLFDDVAVPIECDLLEHKTFEQGVTLQRYGIRHTRR
ncbi:MAG TPA: dihydrofolate reductase family protein [Polyangia bacterium]